MKHPLKAFFTTLQGAVAVCGVREAESFHAR